jgi:outer membrane receptor for monomeric catechols
LNTTLLKTPNDVSVLTRDFLNDIAATSIYDSAQWLTNAYTQEPNTRDFGQGNVVFRGLQGSNGYNLRNYFQNPFNMDAYNIARIEGARGPASIIYADALSGGQVSTLTKRPEFRDKSEAGLRLDSEGGIRTTLDLDRRVTKEIAFRVNGVIRKAGRRSTTTTKIARRSTSRVRIAPGAMRNSAQKPSSATAIAPIFSAPTTMRLPCGMAPPEFPRR